jgi:hypothetical protein
MSRAINWVKIKIMADDHKKIFLLYLSKITCNAKLEWSSITAQVIVKVRENQCIP